MNIRCAHFLPEADKQLGNKYLLLELLGDGTHGWVWRAERLRDGQVVAIKIPKRLSAPERSLVEGKELLGVKPHPNVIQFFDMGKVPPENEWYAIEMEYFPSESLAQKLEHRSGHFGSTFERLFSIYEQVLEAVGYLASLDTPVSHGDIKPHNILIGQGDQVKLTDFGSSALPEEIYVRTRENGGTVLYAAPEFCDCVSRKGDFQALLAGDIYSLGVLLYQLTTGRLPHDTLAQVRSHVPFPKPSEVNSGICPELESVIIHCLEKEPDKRYANISVLQSDFAEARAIQEQGSMVLQIVPQNAEDERDQDWSTEVVRALEDKDYQRAAEVAKAEYLRVGDRNALFSWVRAVFRSGRLLDLEKILKDLKEKLFSPDKNGAELRILGIKGMLKWRNLDFAREILTFALANDPEDYELGLCEAVCAGMNADYPVAREKLENLNREYPMKEEVLGRLVHVCEQQRDYGASAGYLRAALRVSDDEKLREKRLQYERLGVW